jgi:D-glucosaminate-6-phosphate ammonia-lyase
MDLLESYPHIVNGAGTLTRLGGTLMRPEGVQAMARASTRFFDMAELQAQASAVIAEITGAEAGYVTSGAAAALTLAAAACIARLDVGVMEELPFTDAPNEMIIARPHRNSYDHALRAAGARLVEVGWDDRASGAGIRGPELWEFEAAVTGRTCAIAYVAGASAALPLEELTTMAHTHGVPVIVDAANQLPPPTNLRRFIDEGADLVAFSGGKAIRGPQSTGFLAGTSESIASVALQNLDLDVSLSTWSPPDTLIDLDNVRGFPHHGIGRGFKVGKEEIFGLITALESYVRQDHEAEAQRWYGRLQIVADRLAGLETVQVCLPPLDLSGPVPLAEVRFDEARLDRSAYEISRELAHGSPRIFLNEQRAREGLLLVNPFNLDEEEARVIADRLLQICSR